MADTAKPTGKKANKKTMLIVGGVALAVLAFVLLRKKSESGGASNATEPGTQGLSNQSFIPVQGENVAGVGAGAGGGASGESGGGTSALTDFFTQEQERTREYMQAQQIENKENQQQQREWLSTLYANLGSGGGAQTEKGPPGVVVAPPQGGGTTPPGSSPKPSSPAVPMKDVKCPNGCAGHEYPKGKNGKTAKVTECQVKNAKKQCVWP